MNEPMDEIDRAIAQLLAQVHPLNLSELRAQLLLVLASTTGIGSGNRIFAELAVVRTVDELARVDWEVLAVGISVSSSLPEQTCWTLVVHAQLFAERSVLHHCLYLSRAATTLWLMNSWPFHPGELPGELMPIYEEFARGLVEADTALQAGRGHLYAFRRQVQVRSAIRALQELLRRANACYADYLSALDQADQQARYILWYLSQIQAQVADAADMLQRSARHVA